MDEYISKELVLDYLNDFLHSIGEYNLLSDMGQRRALTAAIQDILTMKSADVQERRYCKMIPLEPDLRNCTNVFICTNCHQHIHLGLIRQKYSGSFCIECGAEVKNGDAE